MTPANHRGHGRARRTIGPLAGTASERNGERKSPFVEHPDVRQPAHGRTKVGQDARERAASSAVSALDEESGGKAPGEGQCAQDGCKTYWTMTSAGGYANTCGVVVVIAGGLVGCAACAHYDASCEQEPI